MGYCVEGAVAAVGEDDLVDGDVILLNYPYVTGSHQEDMAVVCPVFLDGGVLVGYTAVKAHFLDIGAKDYFCSDTTDYYQEGTVFRGEALPRGRAPGGHLAYGDRELPGAEGRGRRPQRRGRGGPHRRAALRRVVARHGTETFDAAVEEMYDRGEAAVRKFISGVPDGTYVGRGEMDGDGVVEGRIPLELVVTVAGAT